MAGTLRVFLLVAVCLSIATSISVRESCPQPRLCHNFVPESCSRVVPAHFTFRGKTCPGCDVCIPDGFEMEGTNCISMGCPMVIPPAECQHPRFHNQYYELNGNTCEACGVITC